MSEPIPTITKGYTFSRAFEYTDDAGVGINLTGKIVAVLIHDIFPDATFEMASGDAPTALGSFIAFTDAMSGEFSLKLTDEETLTAVSKCGKLILELRDAGDKTPLWVSDLNVHEV